MSAVGSDHRPLDAACGQPCNDQGRLVSSCEFNENRDVSEELGLIGAPSLASSEVAVVVINRKQMSRSSVEKWTPSTKWVSLNLVTLRKLFFFDFLSFFFEWLKSLALKLMFGVEWSWFSSLMKEFIMKMSSINAVCSSSSPLGRGTSGCLSSKNFVRLAGAIVQRLMRVV